MSSPFHQPQSRFCARLPHDVILAIAAQLASIDPLGPPTHLPPLFLSCRYVHAVLHQHRKFLFARICRDKFDTRAAVRRLGPTAITTTALAFQLKKQTLALKRLRQCDLSSCHLTSDLWTAYLMFMENDGRNYSHLMHYAHLDLFLERFMDSTLWAHRESNLGWPVDSTPNSLVVWMLWFTMSPERLSGMTAERRGKYMDLLRPFALIPAMYYPFHAPDSHFELPDEGVLPQPGDEATPLGLVPTFREPDMVVETVLHYCRRVLIMPPLIGLGAKMVFIMLAEAVPYDPPSILPIDRAHADPTDGVRPTQADFIEWASIRGVQLYRPGSWNWLESLTPEQCRLETGASWRRDLKAISASLDNDWNRLTGCYDPRSFLPLKGVVYTFGSITGLYAGRMQASRSHMLSIPDHFRYRDVVQLDQMPDLTEFPMVAELPVFVRFREHHCIDPETPVPTGISPDGLDDNLQNAYLPHPFVYRHVGRTLRVEVPNSRIAARYEDFEEGRPNSHNPRTCRMCLQSQEEDERRLRARIDVYQERLVHGDYEDAAADDEDAEGVDADPAFRSRSGSVSSDASDVTYYFGDESNPLFLRQLRLEREHEAEAIVDELMSEGVPEDYEEYIENECNGIQDIIITGEVLPRHGEAWHHYHFYGRVRKWDGLIVLVRIPTQFSEDMKQIFRGYLIGNQNFVGSWRMYNANPEAIPLEGPFALSRVDHTVAAPHGGGAQAASTHPAAGVTPESRPRVAAAGTCKLTSITRRAHAAAFPRSSMHISPPHDRGSHSGGGLTPAPRPDPRFTRTPDAASRGLPTLSSDSPPPSRARTDASRALDSELAMHRTAALSNWQQGAAHGEPMRGSSAAREHGTRTSGARTVRIYAGKLFDPETLQLLPRRVITVSPASGLVLDVQPYADEEAQRDVDLSAGDTGGEAVVDLREATVLPGFVDAHVHLFLHPYSERSWEDQLTKESLVERTVRATVHARRTLMAGYTSVRDLGTEGAGDADVQLRKCLAGAEPLIPGPRYFCANRAIIASGSYGPKSALDLHRDGVEGVTGAEFVDGETECARAVRKQVGAGADWIKVRRSSHYRVRTRIADVSTRCARADIQTFTDKELRVLVASARQLGVKVAAHAQTWRAELLPENGGVDTLEHGSNFGPDDALLDAVKQSRIVWVPTLSVFHETDAEKAPGGRWDSTARNFQRALARGVTNIACGGDTGPFPHGDNALEMKLMVRLGADWRHVLRWATLGGWQCVRSAAWEGEEGAARIEKVSEMQEAPALVGDNEVPFGVIRRGFAADIVASRGDLEDGFENAVDRSNITFVMKGGKVFKRDGLELV
ncbi:hypothetical protein BC628DRAFT_1533672 [Trametes gibbosa]|nr:hypothetical protein BC628DRAFT_1533672 [Trametes gibbosa]